MSLAASVLLPALLALPARAGDNGAAVADRVDKELARPALNEVSQAAKDLGSAGQTAGQPTWGSWAKMPATPGVRALLKFLDEELVQPIFRGANAGGAARALGSADAGASAAQGGGGFDADAFSAKVLKLVGLGTADPLALDLAPKPAPAERRPDSLKLVRKRR